MTLPLAHKKVTVIGAGLGGLATALRLRQAGAQVTVLEKTITPAANSRNIARPASAGTWAPLFSPCPSFWRNFSKTSDSNGKSISNSTR
ncbi:MAG: FAD-dependent oxidoreductase [Blastochloris sp.]|nr:FAD-dependent oxidoreductase [Blastochloris sp.]